MTTTTEIMTRAVVLGGVKRTISEHALDLVLRIASLDVDPAGTTTLARRVREAREILEAMKAVET